MKAKCTCCDKIRPLPKISQKFTEETVLLWCNKCKDYTEHNIFEAKIINL